VEEKRNVAARWNMEIAALPANGGGMKLS